MRRLGLYRLLLVRLLLSWSLCFRPCRDSGRAVLRYARMSDGSGRSAVKRTSESQAVFAVSVILVFAK